MEVWLIKRIRVNSIDFGLALKIEYLLGLMGILYSYYIHDSKFLI